MCASHYVCANISLCMHTCSVAADKLHVRPSQILKQKHDQHSLVLARRQMEIQAQKTDNGAGSGQLEQMPGTYPHFALAILLLYGMNTGLSKFTHAAGIQFPSALIGTPSLQVAKTRSIQVYWLCRVLHVWHACGGKRQNNHFRHGLTYLSSQQLASHRQTTKIREIV